MSERRIYLHRGLGETRGVVTLDGRSERLLMTRDGDEQRLRLGARLVARVASLEPALGTAFLDLGDKVEAILPFKPEARPMRGAAVEVEIRAEPRRGKLAIARALGAGEGDPRLLSPGASVAEMLAGFAPNSELVEGRAAEMAADEAEAEALETTHALPGGGDIAIETTRALTAIDVDLADRKGGDAKRVTRQANLAALGLSARLLRLKGLGGIVVIDLVGRGHDGAALLAAARAAFAVDNPGVAIGPVGRFGTMELSLPRRGQPTLEYLCRPDGALSDLSLAHCLIRRLDSEARARPGARLSALCAPAIALAVAPLAPLLADKIGARFTIQPDPRRARDQPEISAA